MFCPLINGECRNDCIFFDNEIPSPPNTKCEFFYSHRKIEAVAFDINQVNNNLIKTQTLMYELNNSIREVLSEFFSNNLTIHSEHKEKFEEIIMKLDNIEFNSGLKS